LLYFFQLHKFVSVKLNKVIGSPVNPKSILLVDNNEKFLHSAVRFLSTDVGFAVVGWAFDADEAFKKIEKFKPDLVLLDINLPDKKSFEMIKIIKSGNHVPRVVLTSFNDEVQYNEGAEVYGADGYVAKTDFCNQIEKIINKLFEN